MALLRREPGLALLVAAFALFVGHFRVVRYMNFQAGVDLALFDQAVWHYSRFEAPLSSIKGFNLLGDHFHPLVAVFAPLYWVWSDPRMLLIAGTLVLAASLVPVFLVVRRRLPRCAAYLMTVAYAVFWGIQVGAGYDFHESELAPLLIALAILFVDTRRWGCFAVAIALLLAIKEDMGILVAFFGVYLLTLRDWRRGGALVAVGLGWYALATEVAIPHFSGGDFTYWTYTQLGDDAPSAVWALLKAPWRLFEVGLSPGVKVETLGYLFAPLLFLSLGSRWCLLLVPFLLERFLSTREALWGTAFHYTLAMSPILVIAAADTLGKLSGRLAPRAVTALAAAMVVLCVATTLSLRESIPRQLAGLAGDFYRGPEYAAEARAAVARVPDEAPVTAHEPALTHLMHRDYADLIVPGRPVRGYLVANLGLPIGAPTGNASFAALDAVLREHLAATRPVSRAGDWVVRRRP